MPNVETGLSCYVNDNDFTSMYPSLMCAIGTANDTLMSATFKIDGFSAIDVQDYYACLINHRENSAYLCSRFHGFPTYCEMLKLLEEA